MATGDDLGSKIVDDFPDDFFASFASPSSDHVTNETQVYELVQPGSQATNFYPVEMKHEGQLPPNFNDAEIASIMQFLQNDLPLVDFTMNPHDESQVNQAIMASLLSPTLPVGSSPLEPNAINPSHDRTNVMQNQQQNPQSAQQLQRSQKVRQQPVTKTADFDYPLNASGCEPCTTAVTTNDNYPHHQQLLEPNSADTKKIRIRCQPRGQFRPRTENESRSSKHYIRCDDGIKPEYPTIDLPYEWALQTDVNIIEVALVGVDKEPHPYTLENKISSSTYDPAALIFKQDQRNILFFRLTDEDFRNGFKTFMMEYIKGKQDEVITKDLIRLRQLDQSMLRFTRIFGLGKDNFHRDESTVQYSSVMKEAYGDIEIEHIGPRYGPMCGNEMVYAILKGRILKNDLTIQIHEGNTNWNHSVENFTKSGNVIYFLMPPFPYAQCERMNVYISINYKGSPIDRYAYLYNKSLDEELAALRISDSNANPTAEGLPNKFDGFDFFNGTGVVPTRLGKKRTSTTTRKRLVQS